MTQPRQAPVAPQAEPEPKFVVSTPKAEKPVAPPKPVRQPEPVRPAAQSGPATRSENDQPAKPLVAATSAHPGLDEGLNWQSCKRGERVDLQPFALQTSATQATEIEVIADSAEASTLDQAARFSGNVELQQGQQRIFADQIDYAHAQAHIQASGQVLLQRPDLRISASEVDYNLGDRSGSARNTEYRLPGIMARGTAERAEFVDAQHSSYDNITYTTCGPGNSDWLLSAERLELDRTEGLGTAHDARLSLLGMPLAWVPKLTFPIDDRRRSGVLIPTVGYSDSHGLDVTVPYYLNLAPAYDLTLSPRVMSERGIMLGGELRFLTHTTEGVIGADFLPHDRKNPADRQRGALSVQTQSRFNPHVSSAIRINHVSDDAFLRDFGGSLDVTSTSHLERAVEARYDTDNWNALARVQSYQTIDPLLPKALRPYERAPQLAFSLDQHPAGQSFAYQVDAEFVNFLKDGGFVEGKRFDLQPGISFPLRKAHYHLVPRASVRYTSYRLENQAAGLDPDPDRLSPIFSVDGGLYYDRSTSLFGESVTHSLEPRMHYLYVPEHDHADIPVFDTSEYDFSFDNLFRENRFNGADRLGDANQLTLALTQRFNHDASGRELLRASIGSIVYFEDREVQLPGSPIDTDQSSAVVGELAADLGNGWHTRGGINWDPHDGDIDQALAQGSYRDDDGNIISLTYRLRDLVTEHTDLGVIWPLNSNTRLIARWNYSISDDRNLETLGGVEYGRCCWKVRAIMRQHSNGPGSTDDLSFLLQLELSGLGRFGDNIDSLLNNGIYGYRREDD